MGWISIGIALIGHSMWLGKYMQHVQKGTVLLKMIIDANWSYTPNKKSLDRDCFVMRPPGKTRVLPVISPNSE